jgi:hypothetical protein
MRITDLQKHNDENGCRVSATIMWEEAHRPPLELYFATDPAFSDSLTCDPQAFLVAALVPAMNHREQRVHIDAPICPQLKDGLLTAMEWLCRWYPPHDRHLSLETARTLRFPRKRARHHSASFLSGGIDSLATLHHNRQTFPDAHPLSIRTCLAVHGFDIGGQANGNPEKDYFNRALQSLAGIADEARATLIPVYTNVRHLDDDCDFWTKEFHGAALASVAHAFSARLSTVSIASSDGLGAPIPWGSHPALDYNYGSADLQIIHDGVRFSRFAKMKQIAEWDAAVGGLRVCTHNPSSGLNCGQCIKCILSMTQLLALGKLSRNHSFPSREVTPQLLNTLRFTRYYECMFFNDVIAPLQAIGRNDLVSVIRKKIIQYHLLFKWADKTDLRGRLKKFDDRHFNNRLRKLYRCVPKNSSRIITRPSNGRLPENENFASPKNR